MQDTSITIGKASGVCQDCYSGVALIERPATININSRNLCDYHAELKMIITTGRDARIKRVCA